MDGSRVVNAPPVPYYITNYRVSRSPFFKTNSHVRSLKDLHYTLVSIPVSVDDFTYLDTWMEDPARVFFALSLAGALRV